MSRYFVNSSSIKAKTKIPMLQRKYKAISGKVLQSGAKQAKVEKKNPNQQTSATVAEEAKSCKEVLKESMHIKAVVLKPDMSHEERVQLEDLCCTLGAEMTDSHESAFQCLISSLQNSHKVSMILAIDHSRSALDQTLHDLTVALSDHLDFTCNTIHFRYYMSDGDTIVNLLDLSSEDTSHIKSRHVSSAEHVIDLIKLGNFSFERTSIAVSSSIKAVFVVQYDVKQLDEVERQIYLVATQWHSLLQSGTFQALDKCIQARQRAQSPIPFKAHALTQQLQALFEEPSTLSIFYAPNSFSGDTLEILKQLLQLQQYGTEDDNFGDKIIQKNQVVLENLNELDEAAVYVYLLNNVSMLENELLNAHQHYSQVMQNWSTDHNFLQKLSNETQLYDVDRYTDQMIQLLQEQHSRISHLIELANMFKLGLQQLKQSVDEKQEQQSAN